MLHYVGRPSAGSPTSRHSTRCGSVCRFSTFAAGDPSLSHASTPPRTCDEKSGLGARRNRRKKDHSQFINQIGACENRRLKEFPPGRVLAPLGCRLDPCRPQDIADNLVGHPVAQVGQCPHDPVVAPGWSLPGPFGPSALQAQAYSRSAGGSNTPGTFELAGRSAPAPAQDGVRPSLATRVTCARALRPSRLPMSASAGPLRIRQTQLGLRIRFSLRQVFVLEEAFLIDEAGHVGQQAQPLVVSDAERP